MLNNQTIFLSPNANTQPSLPKVQLSLTWFFPYTFTVPATKKHKRQIRTIRSTNIGNKKMHQHTSKLVCEWNSSTFSPSNLCLYYTFNGWGLQWVFLTLNWVNGNFVLKLPVSNHVTTKATCYFVYVVKKLAMGGLSLFPQRPI